ncbi:MAG: NAD-dependent epimerase/dehydratase family protein [Planctomycetaceae bacterium]|jgi:nucleoside-diphosphate-sugar epimerase|nr:NAD-dependent epimerase/dehydratase family protein [Planctomycetaceae bacterium]
MKYLITGGAGFIGSNLAGYILDKGHEVVVLDNFATGKRENLASIIDKIILIEGDIRDRSVVDVAVSGCAAIFHEGALGSVPRSVVDPVASHDANVNGTLTVLEAARNAGVKRVIFAASSSAYGEQPASPKVETMPALPISPYAASKTACEAYMQAYAAAYQMETVSLRYFNVFGPHQDPFGAYAAVIPAFVSKILRGEQPEVFGDGGQTRDFCYIANVCYANWLAANTAAENCDGRPMNIACNAAVSLNQILNKLQQLMQKNIEPIYKPVRAGDVRHSLADISLAEKKIGYKPLVSFDEGLELAINWYTENLK